MMVVYDCEDAVENGVVSLPEASVYRVDDVDNVEEEEMNLVPKKRSDGLSPGGLLVTGGTFRKRCREVRLHEVFSLFHGEGSSVSLDILTVEIGGFAGHHVGMMEDGLLWVIEEKS